MLGGLWREIGNIGRCDLQVGLPAERRESRPPKAACQRRKKVGLRRTREHRCAGAEEIIRRGNWGELGKNIAFRKKNIATESSIKMIDEGGTDEKGEKR